jgi:type I restriction enzyme M protein
VHLMTEMLKPESGESIYDPTCGSGGMLLSCIAHLRRQGKEWRNVRLFGQERNLMTSSIARMNCFLHGIEDFRIADYAFWQHIIQSLSPKTGRCAILFPHGVLFRQEEAEMRKKLVEADLVECVLGLGPNLFYNSPMEACVVICRTAKPKARKGRILFINAVNEVTRERAQSFLSDSHLQRVVAAYEAFKDEPGFAAVATLADLRAKDANLSIPLYVSSASKAEQESAKYGVDGLDKALAEWLDSSAKLRRSLEALLK